MKTIRQSVTLARFQKLPEHIILSIEEAGRISHKSEPTGSLADAEAFIRKLIGWGHESVLEHESLRLHIVTDRGISHELVRHRAGIAITQESTRYVAYQGELEVVAPPLQNATSYSSMPPRAIWEKQIARAEAHYHALLACGVPPELARSVLPTCVKTELYVTCNIREWRHIIRLRTHKAAHPQMRELIGMAFDVLSGYVPVCFEDLRNDVE